MSDDLLNPPLKSRINLDFFEPQWQLLVYYHTRWRDPNAGVVMADFDGTKGSRHSFSMMISKIDDFLPDFCLKLHI